MRVTSATSSVGAPRAPLHARDHCSHLRADSVDYAHELVHAQPDLPGRPHRERVADHDPARNLVLGELAAAVRDQLAVRHGAGEHDGCGHELRRRVPSGTPTTAAWRTAGCRSSASETSCGETLSPPTLMIESRRPRITDEAVGVDLGEVAGTEGSRRRAAWRRAGLPSAYASRRPQGPRRRALRVSCRDVHRDAADRAADGVGTREHLIRRMWLAIGSRLGRSVVLADREHRSGSAKRADEIGRERRRAGQQVARRLVEVGRRRDGRLGRRRGRSRERRDRRSRPPCRPARGGARARGAARPSAPLASTASTARSKP